MSRRSIYSVGPVPVQAIFETKSKHYGFFNFLFDIFMVFLTGGLWLIWIFVREMRKR